MTPESVLYGILAVIVTVNLWDAFLSLRQLLVFRANYQSDEAHLGRQLLGTVIFQRLFYGILVNGLEIIFVLYAVLWDIARQWTEKMNLNPDNEFCVTCVFVVVGSFYATLKEIPLDIFGCIFLGTLSSSERRPVFVCIDKMCRRFFAGVFSLPAVAVLMAIVLYGGRFIFIWMGISSSILIALCGIFWDTVQSRFLGAQEPLPEGALRGTLLSLATSQRFPLKEIVVVEGSGNVFVLLPGLLDKKIVLLGVLLAKCTDDEILAIVTREMYHWKRSHNLWKIIMAEVHLLLVCCICNFLYFHPLTYQSLGFVAGIQPFVGFMIFLSYLGPCYLTLVRFTWNIVSRWFEYQADAFAKKLCGDALGSTLVKLEDLEEGFTLYDPWFSAWKHSQPPLASRLAKLDNVKGSNVA